jgi:hypothetical protein
MSQRLFLTVVAALILICAAPAHADTVTAMNPGDLPGTAQDLTGVNVTEITGTITDPNGVDMFKINITDFADFSAMTIGSAFGIPDTDLFLFDASGLGVEANDDAGGNGIGFSLSCLPSAGVSNPCLSPLPAGVGPTSDGIYFLAIGQSANFPLSTDGEIFTTLLSTDVVGPDLTMGGNSPVIGWDDGSFASPDTDLTGFDILLTGTAPVSAPEPATWALIGMGFLAVFLRRKQHARS